MPNSDVQPWRPDPDVEPGVGPATGNSGTSGERGTSAFTGNTDFGADGRPSSTYPSRGPAVGSVYYPNAVAPTNGTVDTATTLRGASGTHVLRTATIALTSSATTFTSGTSQTLTATITATAKYAKNLVVTFKDGATTLGTATASANGVATYTKSGGWTTGSRSLTATTPAGGDFSAATSNTVTATIS